MTEDDVIERTLAIIVLLSDLKEDVLHGDGFQPMFDAGLLDGALAILMANVDDEDARVIAEIERQSARRLAWALHRNHGEVINETNRQAP